MQRYETAVAAPAPGAETGDDPDAPAGDDTDHAERADRHATVGALATTAAAHGYDGLVVANADRDGVTVDGDHPVDVVDGVTIDAEDAETAAGRLGSVRSGSSTEYTVVTVQGGPPAVTRFAAEDERVDAILLGERDAGFDHVVANAAREHGVRVALDLGPVLRDGGERRVAALRDLRRRREILADAGCEPLVTARPTSRFQLRAPRELAAVGEAVGLGGERVHDGLAGWAAAVAFVRERTDPDFVEPGVRRGRYGDWADRETDTDRETGDPGDDPGGDGA